MPARLYGAAAEFAERKYAGGMAEREATFTATTSVQQVFGNDPERVSVLIVNTSTNSVYIGFSEVSVLPMEYYYLPMEVAFNLM